MPPFPRIRRLLLCCCITLGGLFGVVACRAPRLPPATGSPLDIVLLGEPPSSAGFTVLQRSLERTFSPWLADDPGFRLLPAATARGRRPREKNLLLLGTLEASRDWESQVGTWLQPAARERLAQRGAGWFVFRDVWARGQEVVLAVARDTRGLDSLLAREAPALRQHWRESVVERGLAAAWPDTASPAAWQLRRTFGFVIAVPPTYAASPNRSTWVEAVELVRHSPSRTVCVYWLDGADAGRIGSEDFLLGLQQDAMYRMHGDEVIAGTTFFEAPAWDPGRRVLRGTWQNRSDVAGGPFVTHFVYDAARRRLYGVQALLFAPGRRKAVYVVELEALLRTFRVERGA